MIYELSAVGTIIAAYDYTDEHGKLLFQVVRYDPKTFRERRPEGREGWIWDVKGVRLVLYHLPDVVKAHTVLVVEGEKDVETAYRLGLPEGWASTCNPWGAAQWRSEYSETLRGKRVAICPDTDKAGQLHLKQVARNLEGKVAEIRTITLPDHAKDLTEWAEAGGTEESFTALLNRAVLLDFPYDL